MEIANLLLSGPILAALGGVASLAIVVRALTGFLGEAAELRVRLENVEQELDKLRQNLPEKQERVAQGRNQVQPLKAREEKMRAYYARLREIERKNARKEEEKKKEEKTSDQIQIHRPGIPGL